VEGHCTVLVNWLFVLQFIMDEEPVIKEEPYSDGELDPLQMNSEAAVDSEVSHKYGVGQLCFAVMLTDPPDKTSDDPCPNLMLFCLVADGVSCGRAVGYFD
jgi:hypothetical protein